MRDLFGFRNRRLHAKSYQRQQSNKQNIKHSNKLNKQLINKSSKTTN
jgi:hypothetical protein